MELGDELISSDAIALYELVKNSVDAGSKWVSINMQVVLKRSYFQEVLEAIDGGRSLSTVRQQLLSKLESGSPLSSQRLFHDVIQNVDDDRKSIKKRLANIYERENWILVRDIGHGMTKDELQEVFLTIGTHSRRAKKVDRRGYFVDDGRTILGDKGIGRLSAMRLGERMTVVTSRSGELFQNVLDLDWRRFSHDSTEMIEDIEVYPCPGKRKEDPASHGTGIRIRGLRRDWDARTFQRMVEGQFKRIVDPFPTSRGRPGWRDPNDLFRLRFNGTRHEVPEIPLWLLEQAHAVVTAHYEVPSDGAARLRGEIHYRLRTREKQFERIEPELMSFTDPIDDREIRTGPTTLRELGPFSVRFYWFNRALLKELPGIGKKRQIVDTVNAWAGGLMVFRDFFRINPYGGQDDDWLELDKKALASGGYKVNRSQIIGQVSLTARNLRLSEQTSREGLVDNEYKQLLVGILRHILISEFRSFIDKVDKDHKISDDTTTDDLEHRIQETTARIRVRIRKLEREVPEQRVALRQIRRLTGSLSRVVDQAKAIAREYEDDRAKFVHLAGIGLMVEFILHEIGRTTDRALDAFESLDLSRLSRPRSSSLVVLHDQLVTLGRRVKTLDPLSTSRRQTKQSFDIAEVVTQIIEGRSQQFARHGIKVTFDAPHGPYRIRAVKGMLLQIIENLFENSVYWLKVESRRRGDFKPRIEVVADTRAKSLTFRDNGPGVDSSRDKEIFEPFVTSKPPGRGRGLGLYISREIAVYHDWLLYLCVDDGDANGRSSTFVLELSV